MRHHKKMQLLLSYQSLGPNIVLAPTKNRLTACRRSNL